MRKVGDSNGPGPINEMPQKKPTKTSSQTIFFDPTNTGNVKSLHGRVSPQANSYTEISKLFKNVTS